MNRHRNVAVIFGLGLAVVIFTSSFFAVRTTRSSRDLGLEVAASSFAYQVSEIAATLDAQTGALYVLNDDPSGNQIYGYSVNETTGALTLLPGFPISTVGNGERNPDNTSSERLTIDRANQRLYALNSESRTVSAYAINPTTGALAPLPFSPINLGRVGQWNAIAVHPSGSPLVVGDGTGRLLSYQITATTATAAAGSPYSTSNAFPFSATFSQDGNYVYTGGSRGSTIAGFGVNVATGVLTALAGSPFASGDDFPLAYATDAAGRLFVANYNTGQVRVFTTASGIPSSVSGNPFTAGLRGVVHGILHPNGFYLVADEGNNRVGVYRINGSGSATTLAAVTGSPFGAGGSYTEVLALNQAGTFLFAANAGSRNLTTFSVNPATGALTALDTQPANTIGASGRLMGMAYLPAPPVSCPTISGINPTSGAVGANVKITGTNFIGVTSVKFTNNVAAQFIAASDTQILAIVANGAVTGPITISKTDCSDTQTPLFTVTPVGCTYTIFPTSRSFAILGGAGSVSVSVVSPSFGNCPWTAASNAPWITITSGWSGSGSGTVNYLVALNTGAPRNGTMTIAGQTFTVTQAGQ